MARNRNNRPSGERGGRGPGRFAPHRSRRFENRYKALPEGEEMTRHIRKRQTPPGAHVPVLLAEVMGKLLPQHGEVALDCTLGYGGHASALARAVAPTGRVIGMDIDSTELERTNQRLAGEKVALSITTHHANFAEIAKVMAAEGIDGCDIIFADLGVSSMQVDDPDRGISYKHDDGPLDMRMDPGLDRTGADLLMSLSETELSEALRDLADEPDHERIAHWIVNQRTASPITTTSQLKSLVFGAKGTVEKIWKKRAAYEDSHPAQRTFQALRMMVNDELGALKQLLRQVPSCLRPGGRVGIISFHGGEDRMVSDAFREGVQQGIYEASNSKAIRPGVREVYHNSRSSSARFRWARLAGPKQQD